MSDFSATSAATESFQIIRRNPVDLVVWILVYLVTAAVIIAVIAATVGFAAFSNLPEIMKAVTTRTEPDIELVRKMLPAFGAMVAIAVVLGTVMDSVLVTAIKRAVLRPEQRSLGYLRLGGDEVRTFLVRLVRGLVIFAAYLVIVILCVLVAFIHPALIVLVILPGLAGLIFLCVKLSLSVSQSFAERRFNLFGSWSLTKGHFWSLMGAYLLSVVFYIAVALALSIVSMIAGGNGLSSAIMSNPEDLDALLSVGAYAIAVNVVTNLITETFKLPILGVPPAYIYQELASENPA